MFNNYISSGDIHSPVVVFSTAQLKRRGNRFAADDGECLSSAVCFFNAR